MAAGSADDRERLAESLSASMLTGIADVMLECFKGARPLDLHTVRGPDAVQSFSLFLSFCLSLLLL